MVSRRGEETYPKATRLLITADGGGSNGSRLRLWKLELQRLADETGLAITVTHFPLHQQELARTTTDQLQSDREFDRRNHHTDSDY